MVPAEIIALVDATTDLEPLSQMEALTAVHASGSFVERDRRYDASWLAKRIAELEAG